jgi:hypothetical protein
VLENEKKKKAENVRTDKAAQQNMHESDSGLSIARRHPRCTRLGQPSQKAIINPALRKHA